MSRYCNDCSLDNNCDFQKNGRLSCSFGKDKSREQRIKDIDNRAIKVIDELQNIIEQYCSWDLWADAQTISNAADILKKRYEKELMEEYLKERLK